MKKIKGIFFSLLIGGMSISCLNAYTSIDDKNIIIQEYNKTKNNIIKSQKNKYKIEMTKFNEERKKLESFYRKLINIEYDFKLKKYNQIQEKLKDTIKYLNNLINNKNIPNVFPIGGDYQIYEFTGILDIVPKLKDFIEKESKRNNVLAIRTISNSLRDEIEIKRYYINLKIYKNALEKALNFLKLKKYNVSKSIIINSTRMIIVVRKIIPLSVMTSLRLLTKAKKTYKLNVDTAISFLNLSKKGIYRDYVLGYYNESLYKETSKDIQKLINKLKKDKEFDLKLFNKIMKEDFLKIRNYVDKNSNILTFLKRI